MKPQEPPHPTLDRIREIRDQSEPIGVFLDWLSSKGYTICRYVDEGLKHNNKPKFVPAGKSPRQWLGEYFNIDLGEETRERAAVLDYVKSLQTQHDEVSA